MVPVQRRNTTRNLAGLSGGWLEALSVEAVKPVRPRNAGLSQGFDSPFANREEDKMDEEKMLNIFEGLARLQMRLLGALPQASINLRTIPSMDQDDIIPDLSLTVTVRDRGVANHDESIISPVVVTSLESTTFWDNLFDSICLRVGRKTGSLYLERINQRLKGLR